MSVYKSHENHQFPKLLVSITRTKHNFLVEYDTLSGKDFCDYKLDDRGILKIYEYLISLPDDCFVYKDGQQIFSIGRVYGFFKLRHTTNINNLKEKFSSILSPSDMDDCIELLKSIVETHSYQSQVNTIAYDVPEIKLIHEKLMNKVNVISNISLSRFKILERDNFTCRACGRTAPNVILHVDHWIPKCKGGNNNPDNLVTLCIDCNLSKSGNMPNGSPP